MNNRLISNYGPIALIRLCYSFVITRLFFHPARLIRQPIYIRGRKRIKWGRGFTTGVGVRLDAFGQSADLNLVIGENVQLNDYVHIGAIERVSIGDDVMVASRVFISDHNHGNYNTGEHTSNPDIAPSKRLLSAAPVFIGDRVWIGENVCILPGVSIGDGAVIGAGSVVTHNIPAESIAVGVPARVIKTYSRLKKEWVRV